MCSPARCSNCSKTTWSGCGQHVDQVMRGVPKTIRCACTAEEKSQARRSGSLMSRLLGR